jgi:hypothetical protein
MFRCNNCGGVQTKGVKTERAVVERRNVEYTEKDKNGKDRVIGRGWEIVKELVLCKICRPLFA